MFLTTHNLFLKLLKGELNFSIYIPRYFFIIRVLGCSLKKLRSHSRVVHFKLRAALSLILHIGLNSAYFDKERQTPSAESVSFTETFLKHNYITFWRLIKFPISVYGHPGPFKVYPESCLPEPWSGALSKGSTYFFICTRRPCAEPRRNSSLLLVAAFCLSRVFHVSLSSPGMSSQVV